LQQWSRLFIGEEAGLRLWRRSDGDGARQEDKAEKKTFVCIHYELKKGENCDVLAPVKSLFNRPCDFRR